jgi:hypothetical protein
MTFNYKDLSARVRATFAAAATPEVEELIQRVNFEEAIADRSGLNQPTVNQRLLYILEQNVPNIAPHVLTAATMLTLPSGMVNEHRALDRLTPAARDLYLEARRNFSPAMAVMQSEEIKQLTLASLIMNAEFTEEMRQSRYVPYAQMKGLAQDMKLVETMLKQRSPASVSPLEKLFFDTSARINQAADDYFNAHNKKPPHP